VPRALYISIAVAAVLFVLFAYATVTVLAWIAGIVSVLAGPGRRRKPPGACSSTGASGLLPARLGRLRQPSDTPVNALIVMAAAGLGIIGAWWLVHLITGRTGLMNAVGLYAECSPPWARS
jgi:amino acid transporter